jgi:hypothetical protein
MFSLFLHKNISQVEIAEFVASALNLIKFNLEILQENNKLIEFYSKFII